MSVAVLSTANVTFPAYTVCPLYEDAYRQEFLQRFEMDRYGSLCGRVART